MKFNDPYIGSPHGNSIVPFSGGDSLELFGQTILTQSKDWYYRTADVNYSYNKYGHRCKDPDCVDMDNYILFAGCSHTEGVGLEVNHTYPYVAANLLNIDYYNLAVGGCGMDVVTYNLQSWFFTTIKKPKCVVIQWPEHHRFTSTVPHLNDYLNPSGTWALSEDNNDVKKFFYAGDELEFFLLRENMFKQYIELLVDVPILYVSYMSPNTNDSANRVDLPREDLARDLSHSGIRSNQIAAHNLVKQIKTL